MENTPAVEQAPVVTEYVRTYAESPVFTTEKFGAVSEETPVAVQMPVEMPAQAPVQAVAVSVEAQYSLSHMAKMVLATFLAVVTVMLAVICVNTHLINQKTLQLQTLEARNAELVEENTAIQNRIAKARSEEAIRDYAISQGMIEGNR